MTWSSVVICTENDFIALYLRNGWLVAALAVGQRREYRSARKLLMNRIPVAASELREARDSAGAAEGWRNHLTPGLDPRNSWIPCGRTGSRWTTPMNVRTTNMATAPELQEALTTLDGQEHEEDVIRELQSIGPVVDHGPTGGKMILTHAGCRHLLESDEDARTVHRVLALFFHGKEQERFHEMMDTMSRFVLFLDPPQHTQLRTLLQRSFTPHLIRSMEPQLQALLDGFLDELEASDEPDIMEHLANQLPTAVIATVLGIPEESREVFKPLADSMARLVAETPSLELAESVRPDSKAMVSFIEEQVAQKRANPGKDLLSSMIAAEDSGHRLDDQDLVANTILLLIAGHETTTNLIGNGTLAAMQHREQWDRMVADPSLVPSAVEEFVRFDPPFQQTLRLAARDIEVEGEVIPELTPLVLSLASANHDPAAFDDPWSLDITRSPNDHLAFGAGTHYCLGNVLARTEGRLTFSALIQRYPKMKIDESRPLKRKLSRTLRGLYSLPVELG